MLSWLRRRRERTERIDAKVKALTRAFGVDAHYEARKRQREAESGETAREWSAVARAIAHRTGRLRLGWRSTRISPPEATLTPRSRKLISSMSCKNSEEGSMRVLLTGALIVGFASQTGELLAYECNNNHYVNSSGHLVHSPSCGREPLHRTADCHDGSVSYSEHHRGACSYHGGVAYDAVLYKQRHKIENMFGRLKDWRRIHHPIRPLRPHLLVGNLHRRCRPLLALINES